MVGFKGQGYILRTADRSRPVVGNVSPSKQLGEIGMRQLFDEDSCSYTYILWDKDTEDAILVDPVDTQVSRDLLVSTTFNLVYGVNTHVHADHFSGTRLLKKQVKGFKSVISRNSTAKADELIDDGDEIHFGNRYITALATPGHTEGCMSFVTDDGKAVMTGDTLLILGCGRTDFQGGSAETLYDSIHEQLFTLPDDCVVFPGHDYNGNTRSTIGKEKAENPRLRAGMTKSEFVELMEHLGLDMPQKIDLAVPANLLDGAKPFFIRSLRSRIKNRWGIFG